MWAEKAKNNSLLMRRPERRTMHQPDSDHHIETTIDGEHVSGTVHFAGSTDISVRLEYPSSALEDGVHMPNFARPVFREGFLGDYGEQRAVQLLEGLYREQKRGTARRKDFAGDRGDFEEFGRVRYVAVNPGHPDRHRIVLERADINDSVSVQLEDDGPYRYARLFDTSTGQPFLGEASIVENTVGEYVKGVKQDIAFRLYIMNLHLKLLPSLSDKAKQLDALGLTPRQADFLKEFKRARRMGDLGLEASEIEDLIERGYLKRDRLRGLAERLILERTLEDRIKATANFEAAGKLDAAARCRAKVQKLRNRIEVMTLEITERGKAAAAQCPPIDSD
jgi:hypothetical protein